MSMSLSQKDAYTMIFKEYPDVVSVTQMSKMLGISEKSAYRLLKKNCIEHFKVAGPIRFLNYIFLITCTLSDEVNPYPCRILPQLLRYKRQQRVNTATAWKEENNGSRTPERTKWLLSNDPELERQGWKT